MEQPNDAAAGHDHPPGMPRWVKLLAVAVVALLVVLVVVMLLAGGDHGPGRHRG